MNLIELFKEIKFKELDNTNNNIEYFLIYEKLLEYKGPIEDNVNLCIKVEDGIIYLQPDMFLTVDSMLHDDWLLHVVYKKDNSDGRMGYIKLNLDDKQLFKRI